VRSILAGLRRLVIPWGASGATPRVVLDADDPILQALSQEAGIGFYYADQRAFFLLVEHSGGTLGQFTIAGISDQPGEFSDVQLIRLEHDYTSGADEVQIGTTADVSRIGSIVTAVEVERAAGRVNLRAANTIHLRAVVHLGSSAVPEWDEEATDISGFVHTSYATTGQPAGTSGYCGVVFVAPPSGKGIVHFSARLENTGAAVSDRTLIGPTVRTGSVFGGGSEHRAPSDSYALESHDRLNAAHFREVFDLTPGSTYHAYLVHRVNNGTGNIFHRVIKWKPDLA
jgi:hypothetical protein